MRRIEGDDDIRDGLAELARLDSRLAPVIARVGAVPLRRRPAGFEGLARIVVAQQVSAAAATAIWARFETALGEPVTAAAVARLDDDGFRRGGLSTPKIRTLRAVAAAVEAGLDLGALALLPAPRAIEDLTLIKGIGPWTAEIFLLFCAGHPDVWPGGDLALRVAVGEAFALAERPSETEVRAIASAWAPWRGVAARLFWAFHAVVRSGRDGAPA